jgi:hypothetical protein
MSTPTHLLILLITSLLPSGLIQAKITDHPALSVNTTVEVPNLELSIASAQCPAGWYIFGNTGICADCADCQDCTSCQDYEMGCVVCNSGYYLWENNIGLCYECVVNACLACKDTVGCVQCQSGYYLYYSSYYGWDCNNCPRNCQTCSDETTCQECNEGYEIVNGTCTSGSGNGSGIILSSYLGLLFVCGLLLL